MSSRLQQPRSDGDVAERDLLRRGIEQRLGELAPLLDAHAGGVEILDVTAGGSVELRFTGMCTGCPYRPLTMAATLRPALLRVPGVTHVVAEGSRISAEAEERLAGYLAAAPSRWNLPSRIDPRAGCPSG